MPDVFAWADADTQSMLVDTICAYRRLVYGLIGLAWVNWSSAMQERLEQLGDCSLYATPVFSETLIGVEIASESETFLPFVSGFHDPPNFLMRKAAAAVQTFFFTHYPERLYANSSNLISENQIKRILQTLDVHTSRYADLSVKIPLSTLLWNDVFEFVRLDENRNQAVITLYDKNSRCWSHRTIYSTLHADVPDAAWRDESEGLHKIPERLLRWHTAPGKAIATLTFRWKPLPEETLEDWSYLDGLQVSAEFVNYTVML